MGAELSIYNLYELIGNEEASFLITKAIRPCFSNSNQQEENEAFSSVQKTFDNLLWMEKFRIHFTLVNKIATWEGGFPSGEKFYEGVPPFLCKVWISTDTKYRKYFVFGEAVTEDAFWKELMELYEDGDLWGYEEFAKPARLETVWFVCQ